MQAASSQTDPKRLVKTSTPGVYKRGNRYAVVVRNGGKQVKRFAKTMAEARTIKAELTADVGRGDFRPTRSSRSRATSTPGGRRTPAGRLVASAPRR
jgi:hypothetical protein